MAASFRLTRSSAMSPVKHSSTSQGRQQVTWNIRFSGGRSFLRQKKNCEVVIRPTPRASHAFQERIPGVSFHVTDILWQRVKQHLGFPEVRARSSEWSSNPSG